MENIFKDEILGFLYAVAKLSGILPVRRYFSRRKFYQFKSMNKYPGEYKIAFKVRANYATSNWGLLFCANAAIFMVYAMYESYRFMEWPCFTTNDCAIWLLSWNHATIAVFEVVAAAWHQTTTAARLNESSRLLEAANFISGKNKDYTFGIGKYCLLSVLVLGVKTWAMLASPYGTNEIIIALYHISLVVPLLMQCVIVSMYRVIDNACYKINERLGELASSSSKSSSHVSSSTSKWQGNSFEYEMRAMMNVYERAKNLSSGISECFAFDLLADLSYNAVWFVVYTYIMIVSIWTTYYTLWKKVAISLEFAFLALRLYYVSYRMNCMEHEVSKIPVLLGNLRKMDTHWKCLQLGSKFQLQVLRSDLNVQVYGIFQMNLSFMRGIISLATTYLIVFIQYGLSYTDISRNSTSINDTDLELNSTK